MDRPAPPPKETSKNEIKTRYKFEMSDLSRRPRSPLFYQKPTCDDDVAITRNATRNKTTSHDRDWAAVTDTRTKSTTHKSAAAHDHGHAQRSEAVLK